MEKPISRGVAYVFGEDQYLRLCAAIAAEAVEAERANTADLHERLECCQAFTMIDGVMTRIPQEHGSIPDGIECRDETIKLLEDRIKELSAERSRVAEGAGMTDDEFTRLFDDTIKGVAPEDVLSVYSRALIAEATARERERCARWLREREQESLENAKDFTDDEVLAGLGGEAWAYNQAAEFIEQNPSAAAHRAGEGE